MEFRDNPTEAEFRAEVQTFLRDEYPESRRSTQNIEWGMLNGSARRTRSGASGWWKEWVAKLNARGWGLPAWPTEYGGGALSVKQQFILSETFARQRAPRPGGIGHGYAGPTIMVYGSDEQKSHYLPRIVSGDDHWCQLFSEPGAGSDLASLQTRAVRDGDDYVVNGQKIWTSGGHRSDMGILIARTDPDAPKHRGISYFMLDMKTPGITIRPLVNMLDSHEFNEVFFEDVRIPVSNMLGEENRGWYLAATTLDIERSSISMSVSHGLIAQDLINYAKDAPVNESTLARRESLRSELAERALEAQVEELFSYKIISMQERGEIPNREASVTKLFVSEMDRRLASTAMAISGMYGQLDNRDDERALSGRIARFYLHATSSTIGGGTSEIQRNIIATRGLQMPRG